MTGPLDRRCWARLGLAALLSTLGSSTRLDASDGIARAIEACRATTEQIIADDRAPGMSVAVGRHGTLLWSEGFGHADLELDVPVTADTRFGLGSITKSLTTALCARLVDQGRLDLDAPVETYLPKFPHAGRGITVRLIAGHLSGIDDSFTGARRFSNERFETTRDALVHIWGAELQSTPGTEHAYATGLYTIIAAVVESVTDVTFPEAMQEHVLDPLEMFNTVPNDRTRIVPGRTRFYLRHDDDTWYEAATFDPSHKLAGAGYLSTVGDMATFGMALLGDDFLSGEAKDALFANLRTADGEPTGFGMGWRIDEDERGNTIYHQPGGGPGISAWIILVPEDDLVAVAMSNYASSPTLNPLLKAAELFRKVDAD